MTLVIDVCVREGEEWYRVRYEDAIAAAKTARASTSSSGQLRPGTSSAHMYATPQGSSEGQMIEREENDGNVFNSDELNFVEINNA